MMTAGDTKAALRTFDEHLHLMTLIEPHCIQESLQTAGLLPNSDPFTSTTTVAGSVLMEKVLTEVRNCIELNGAEKFLMFISVLQTEGRYIVFGYHIFSKLHTYMHAYYIPYARVIFKRENFYRFHSFVVTTKVLSSVRIGNLM